MNPETWRRIEAICSAALERAGSEREAFLDAACGGDEALRREVARVIAGDEHAGGFLEAPAWDLARTVTERRSGDTPVGRRLGHYRILALMGTGGMGEVYRARDTRLGREVALKLLPARLTADPEQLHRFAQEARAASALDHPNIVSVHDIGESELGRFIVMELVPGRTLREHARDGLTLEALVAVIAQVAKALATAHAAGIVHRDIKPENVMVRDDGYVKVLDFGVARLTSDGVMPTGAAIAFATGTGVVLGTMSYMSPEQARGDTVTGATDIFSLGIVLYELATRQHPFQADSQMGVLLRILTDSPVPPAQLEPRIPGALNAVILRMLEKDPRRRPTAADVEAVLSTTRTVRPTRSGDSRRLRRRAFVSAAALAAIVTVAAAFDIGGLRERVLGTPAAPPIRSIAVLPLQNLSRDRDQEFFSDGMTEALISSLAKVHALDVTSRTSVMRFKGTSQPVSAIGSQLGVDAILEGSVQRSGGRVRVTAQLIRASTDTHLWTGEFEGAATDVLTLQSDVAKAIAREIQVHVTAQESSRLARARPVDAEAHDAYLLGRSQFWQQNEASLRSAVDHFERAVELQPDNADAHAALSLAWGSLVDLGFSREEGARRSAAERALALDPDLSEAHAALALVKFHDWDWAAAEAAFRRARELNPDSVAVCGCYALALAAWSRFQEALDLAEHGIKVNPLSPDMQLHYGIVLYLARRFEEAVPPLKRAIELAPRYRLAYAILTQVHRQLGKSPEAVVLLDRPELRGDSAQGSAYAGVGRRAESLAIARALTAAGADPFGTAMIYFALGDRDRGFERLTVAFAQRQGNVRFINVIPLFDGVRADPRFQALVARLNLPR